MDHPDNSEHRTHFLGEAFVTGPIVGQGAACVTRGKVPVGVQVEVVRQGRVVHNGRIVLMTVGPYTGSVVFTIDGFMLQPGDIIEAYARQG